MFEELIVDFLLFIKVVKFKIRVSDLSDSSNFLFLKFTVSETLFPTET